MSAPSPATATPRTNSLAITTAYLALAALVLSPLLWVAVPVLVDYPSHLARMWLLAQAGKGQASANYIVQWQLVPNLAMDLFVPVLARWMNVETAGRVFVAVAMLLPVLGTITLHRALHARTGLWPLASFLFAYHSVLQWGFLNFLFGMGVALLLFSGWIASTGWRAPIRLAVFALAAVALFLLHLFAFGIYGLLVAAHAGSAWLRRGEWTLTGLPRAGLGLTQFLPAIALWLATMRGGGPSYTQYGELSDKLYAFTAPMGYGIAGPLLGFCVFPLTYLAWRARWLRFAPGMGVPILILLLTAVVMPNWVMGSWQADIRIPAFLPFLIIGSSQLVVTRRAGLRLAALALLLLCVRVYGLSATWIDIDRQFSEFRAALHDVPKRARLLVVQSELTGTRPVAGAPGLIANHWNIDYVHMPALAVIDRDAFMPYLFTGWTTIVPAAQLAGLWNSQAQPVTPESLTAALDPRNRAALSAARGVLREAPHWLDWPEKFDFVVWIDFGHPPDALPAPLQPVHKGSFFRLYRIARP